MPWTVNCPSYRQPQQSILSTLLNSSTLPVSPVLPNSPLSHCVILALFHQALDNPHPSPNSRQHTAALVVVCCRAQSTDFCYCHTSCHLVATIQLCFSSAYTLTDFNPVTNLPHQKEVDVLVKPSLKHLYPKSAPLFIVQDCPNTTFRPCSYFHPECRPLILQCQANILFVSSCPKPKP
jgi:hypothetical protein